MLKRKFPEKLSLYPHTDTEDIIEAANAEMLAEQLLKHTEGNREEIALKLKNSVDNTIPLNEDIRNSMNASDKGQSQ